MTSDLPDLYQGPLLDHGRRPRNFHRPEGANRRASGENPLCGDRLTVFLRIDGDVVLDAGFEGSGCVVAKASASLLTEGVKGKTTCEAEALLDRLRRLLIASDGAGFDRDGLGAISALAGVREVAARVSCADLARSTMAAALHAPEAPVSL